MDKANRIIGEQRSRMTRYRRSHTPDAIWFFTVNLAERRGNTRLVDHIDALGDSFRSVRTRHPFHMEAIVVLPDHLHCLWRLPPGESDNATRWSLIKAGFSRALPPGERVSTSRRRRGERGIWQRRFWEHQIRDERDFARHADYIHYNPVKHLIRGHRRRMATFVVSCIRCKGRLPSQLGRRRCRHSSSRVIVGCGERSEPHRSRAEINARE